MINNKPYNKIITIYDIRKAIHLNYGTNPVRKTLDSITNYKSNARPYLLNTSANYLADLETVVDNLELKSTFDLIPYADTIYLEQYYHTLPHSIQQFHYDHIAVIRRFTKMFDKDRVFSKLDYKDNIISMFLSKVLLCGMGAFNEYLGMLPVRDCTHYTWCICEFMREAVPRSIEDSYIKAYEIVEICDMIYNIQFGKDNEDESKGIKA